MNSLAFASILLSMAAATQDGAPALTFDEAVALATTRYTASGTTPLASELAAVRRAHLPNIRLEMTANTSRTLDLFSEGPFEVRYATSAVAFDYPIWDGGATRARISAVEAKLRRASERGALDDARFAQLLDAFGELYLAQKQQEIVRPLFERMSGESDRSAVLLSSGEISNLIATERREIALSFASRLLELEARRIDAAARLRLLTGVEGEPALVLDFSDSATPDAGTVRDDIVDATTIAVEESRARFREVRASSGFRAMLSGFAGIGAAQSEFRDLSSEGSFGVYGLRVHLTYPLFGGTSDLAMAEARADLQRSLQARDAAIDAARNRASEYRLREETSRKRIDLLRQSLSASREREESLHRLVSAGVRSENDLAGAQAERTRREMDLLAAEIERWKAGRLLARMSASDQP